jgi:transposase
LEFERNIELYQKEGCPIVYLDESGFAFDIPRTHGYSIIGQRCYGEQDWHARGRTNVIGAITGKEFITTCLFETTIDSGIFYAWLTEDLLPKLSEHSVIVMDNATFHKRSDMTAAIKNAGHNLEYLPPYSPDLNPIEHKWHQAKAKKREVQCSVYELFQNHF